MASLVKRLSKGKHAVIVGGPQPSLDNLREAIGREYIQFKFTETKGGTDLGVRLDMDACEIDEAVLQSGQGAVHLEGTLTLDYVPVRCIADLDLESLTGTGRLVIVEEDNEDSSPAPQVPRKRTR